MLGRPSPPPGSAARSSGASAASAGGAAPASVGADDADLAPVTAMAGRPSQRPRAAQRQLAAKLASRLRTSGSSGAAGASGGLGGSGGAGGLFPPLGCATDSDDGEGVAEGGSDTLGGVQDRMGVFSRGSAGSAGAPWLSAGAREHLAKLSRASLGGGSLAGSLGGCSLSGSDGGAAPAMALPELDTL
jgi:hypothetical protein